MIRALPWFPVVVYHSMLSSENGWYNHNWFKKYYYNIWDKQYTVATPVIWDTTALTMTSLECVIFNPMAQFQRPLLLTWINFNSSMDK